MELNNLLRSNSINKILVEVYIERIKTLYPEYRVFVSIGDPDFIIFRKKVGQSTFGQKPNVFTVDITTDVKIHYTQLYQLL
jgi:hypothetical protein